MILIGIIVVICGLVAIFGEISFSFGAGNPTETSLPTETITPIIVSTATPAETATLAPTATPVYESANIDVLCESDTIQYVYEHQPVSIGSFALATTEEQVNDFMNKSLLNVDFDGEEIANLMAFYIPYYDPEYEGYRVDFGFANDPLPLGMHLIESTLSFTDKYTDGVYEYGPGTDLETITFQCPVLVGAPDDSWQVVASSDFSFDQGIFNSRDVDGQVAKTHGREAENGTYRVSIEPTSADYQDSWILFNSPIQPLPESTNFILSFDAQLIQQQSDAEYGVAFRYNQDTGDGYILRLDQSTQNIQFYSSTNNNQDTNTLYEGNPTAFLTEGKNRIVLMASDNTFILWLNGEFIFMVEDNAISTPGSLDIQAAAVGPGQSIFEFDNLLLRAQQP